jgi:hypothetical protein
MNDFEQLLRDALHHKAIEIRSDPAGAARVLRRSRRGRVVTALAAGIGAVAAVTLIFAAVRALPPGTNRLPLGPRTPTASPSPLVPPDPCLTDVPSPNGECGWLFDADLDGDGARDQVALIVSLDHEGFVPESAELQAVLASGSTSSTAVEVDPFAGFPQPVPDLFWPDDVGPGVLDLNGDGRDEVVLSLFQSGAGRLFVRLFVWEADGLHGVTAAGESAGSPRRLAFEVEGDVRGEFAPFELILGGSAGFGGGLHCSNADGDPERELVLRFYWYAADPDFYELHEAVYDLDGAVATEARSDAETVPAELVDDSFRSVECGA